MVDSKLARLASHLEPRFVLFQGGYMARFLSLSDSSSLSSLSSRELSSSSSNPRVGSFLPSSRPPFPAFSSFPSKAAPWSLYQRNWVVWERASGHVGFDVVLVHDVQAVQVGLSVQGNIASPVREVWTHVLLTAKKSLPYRRAS